MEKKGYVVLSRRFFYFMVAILSWYGLTSGLQAFLGGGLFWGLFEVIASVVIIYILTRERLAERIEDRHIPTRMVVLFVLVILVIGVSELWSLFNLDLVILGEVQLPEIIGALSSVGYISILIIFISQYRNLTIKE